MLELALYPAYRDVYAAAEAQLRSAATPGTVAPGNSAMPAPRSRRLRRRWRSSFTRRWGSGGARGLLHCTPVEAAERMIATTPRLLEHRKGGKRRRIASANRRCARSAGPPCCCRSRCPLERQCGGSPRRTSSARQMVRSALSSTMARPLATTTSPEPGTGGSRVRRSVETGDVPMDQIGLSTGTANKHFNKLGQIHSFTRKAVPIAEADRLR